MRSYPKKFDHCPHINTAIDEPHLAGARKCLDCGAKKMSASANFVKYSLLYKYAFKFKDDFIWRSTIGFYPNDELAVKEIFFYGYKGTNLELLKVKNNYIEVKSE